MLDMGFKPQVDRIVKRVPRNRQTMFFSATLDGEVGVLARAYVEPLPLLGRPRRPTEPSGRSSTGSFRRPEHEGRDARRAPRGLDALTLVFVRTKRGADRLVKRLDRHGVKADSLHGDMRQSARRRALDRFESGKVSVLVATDVARGLDIDDVENVINFDPPEEDKGYLHRTGRTGRAGGAASR